MQPELGRATVAQVGAQQIAPLAPAHLSQLVLAQAKAERLGADRLTGFRQLDVDQAVDPAGVLLGGAELEQELVAADVLALQLSQAGPQLLAARRRRMPRSLRTRRSLRARMYSSPSCARSLTLTDCRTCSQGWLRNAVSNRLKRPLGVPTR